MIPHRETAFMCSSHVTLKRKSARYAMICRRSMKPTTACVTTNSRPTQENTQTKEIDNRVPLLEMRSMTYQPWMNFSKYVFSDMNFKVYDKEFIVIVGANGAGKSTALNLMTGIMKVERGKGQIYWKGEKVKPRSMLKRIGIVMQNPSDYFISETILDEMIIGCEYATPDQVRQNLYATGLTNISLLAHPKSLSGGQTRRLALAIQLMRQPLPPLFVLDEPLAGVDWAGRRDLIKFLGSLKDQFAIIIVSHEPGELLKYADRVVEVSRLGMHDIDPKIIRKAIKVRAKLIAEKKANAIKNAALYWQRKSFEEDNDIDI